MIIQALAAIAGNLLQIGSLLMWFIRPKLFDKTALEKWLRNTTLPQVSWGWYFPTYTNFACIAPMRNTHNTSTSTPPPPATTAITRRMRLKCAASTEPAKPRNPATSSPNSTPAERDTLVRAALRYEALRARRPNVLLPRDDLGVYDEEIRKLESLGRGNIWVTKHGTASDRRERMVYGRNPPDFSEVDFIVL